MCFIYNNFNGLISAGSQVANKILLFHAKIIALNKTIVRHKTYLWIVKRLLNNPIFSI